MLTKPVFSHLALGALLLAGAAHSAFARADADDYSRGRYSAPYERGVYQDQDRHLDGYLSQRWEYRHEDWRHRDFDRDDHGYTRVYSAPVVHVAPPHIYSQGGVVVGVTPVYRSQW